MPLTTATAFAAAAVGSAAARQQHARYRPRFFHRRTQHHIVPVDSTLHEASVMRTLAQGLRRRDADYLVAALKSLTVALQVHHDVEVVPADALLDALVPMVRRHCRLDAVRARLKEMVESGAVSPGSEQDYACCLVDSAAVFVGRGVVEDPN